MERPLLIAAIYAPSPLNAEWYALQRRFIAETTNVDHVFGVFLNGVDPKGFDAADVLGVSKTNRGHAQALGEVLDLFRARPYHTYLILDSDCFPVTKGWHGILTRQMLRFDKRIAAPVRTENLDLFPHPSAVFLHRSALDEPWLDLGDTVPVNNLLGQPVADVGAAMQDARHVLFPLLRTNVVNVHPVAAAIYHHLFYHHGAGSRDFTFRILKKFQYYDHWYNSGSGSPRDEILAAFLRDPDRFIGRLLGEHEPLVRHHLVNPRAV